MTPVRAAVVDHGAGNLVSVRAALEAAGAVVTIASRPSGLAGVSLIVVPGVGASRPAMARLRRSGLDDAIRASLDDGAWYLGICLGLQLLFERSEEDGAELLGLLGGTVRPIVGAPRLPHIGWNAIERRRRHSLLEGIPDGAAAYFVHSFVGVPDDPSVVLAQTEHGGRFPSVVASGRLLGTQFHPERSGSRGLRLLANAVALAGA
ncbi:MAG: imidazole glycerol phosphate synthase glutamine amidotransferase subunit HisH [Chloroflexi bacterium CSP1-4]|nr:MAG: imidazole glycerol phosphate synthase glutamine amidotransferase subunit HisH [Chloroflexi bacterium CSP1-4]